jgi:hypothetical protein
VSSDHGPGAPSFGDLFEDPDSPLAPPESPAAPAASPDPVVVAPVEAPAPETPSSEAADRAAHDLDHESSEASHLVAGFESADEDPVVVVPPAPDEPVEVEPLGAAPVVASVAAAGVSVPASPWDGTVDRSVSSAPAGRVDTGRLYRSAGAEGPSTLDAIPAIDPARVPARRVEAVDDERPATVRSAQRGLTYSGVVVIVMGVTVLVALAEALLRNEIGALTGIALLVSSVYCALVVRRADIWAAVVIPPLAFLVAVVTAGQLTIRAKSGGLLVREGALLFVSLATNAPWILGTTLVCLAIVLVRRHRAKAA